MEPRVTLVAGDYTRDALPTGFDFAWISAIIHQMDRSESRALYAKAFKALNPGGTVAVRDYDSNKAGILKNVPGCRILTRPGSCSKDTLIKPALRLYGAPPSEDSSLISASLILRLR